MAKLNKIRNGGVKKIKKALSSYPISVKCLYLLPPNDTKCLCSKNTIAIATFQWRTTGSTMYQL